MATSILTLQNELEKAKERLKGVEEHIKKSIGRDINSGPPLQRAGFKRTARQIDAPVEAPLRPRFQNEGIKSRLGEFVRTGEHDFRGRVNRRISLNEPPSRLRKLEKNEDRIPAKKRLGEQPTAVTVFSRLSGPPKDDEPDEKDPSFKITSQVIVQDAPSRKEVLAAQNGDNQSKARNRRMFGALLGTLQKFRQEENQLREKEDKRAQVEKKLEEAALREKEELKKKRQELFSNRRQQQIEIRQLEYKLLRLKQLTEWESTKKHLLNFIQTKTSPKIFYLPKVHNEKTSQLLEESRDNIQNMIDNKRAEVEKAIADHAALKKSAKGGTRSDAHEEGEESGGEEEAMEGTEEEEVMVKKEPVSDSVVVKKEEGGDGEGKEEMDTSQAADDDEVEGKDEDEGDDSESEDDDGAKREENGLSEKENESADDDDEEGGDDEGRADEEEGEHLPPLPASPPT